MNVEKSDESIWEANFSFLNRYDEKGFFRVQLRSGSRLGTCIFFVASKKWSVFIYLDFTRTYLAIHAPE